MTIWSVCAECCEEFEVLHECSHIRTVADLRDEHDDQALDEYRTYRVDPRDDPELEALMDAGPPEDQE